MKIRVNKKSISVKLEELRKQTVTSVTHRLESMAYDISVRSPVSSGAYAESHSVVPSSSGGGRSKSSSGKPRNQPTEVYQKIAFDNMASDINALDIENLQTSSVSFRNRAPHAGDVEDKHQVFGAVKDKYRSMR